MIIANLNKNIEKRQKVLSQVIKIVSPDQACTCHDALACAIVTDRKIIPEKIKKDLKPIIGKIY